MESKKTARYKSSFDCLTKIVKEKGVKGLYFGI